MCGPLPFSGELQLRYCPWPSLRRSSCQQCQAKGPSSDHYWDAVDIDNAMSAGSISTLTFDLVILVEAVTSDNLIAPTFRVLARSLPERLVEFGSIRLEQNRETDAECYTLTIRDHGFNANLGHAAHQDDPTLRAPIPRGPKEAALARSWPGGPANPSGLGPQNGEPILSNGWA